MVDYKEIRKKDIEEIGKVYGTFEVSKKDFDKLDDFINEVYSKGYERGLSNNWIKYNSQMLINVNQF